jgi:hypothetical protein
MRSNLTRLILPNRTALWTALAALKLDCRNVNKNFYKSLSEIIEEFKSVAKPSSPESGSKIPFRYDEKVGTAIRLSAWQHTKGAEHLESALNYVRLAATIIQILPFGGVPPKIFVTIPSSDVRAGVKGGLSAGMYLANIASPVGIGRAAQTGTLSAASVVQGGLISMAIDTAFTLAHVGKMDQIPHLLPESGEHDPDQCTCVTSIPGLDQPCLAIAKVIFKQRRGNIKWSLLNIPTSGYADMVPRKIVDGVRWLATDDTKMKLFLADKSKVAFHLWQAAQTFGKSQQIQEDKSYNATYTSRWIIPGIAVTKRGCPKAISIIAALFGEFREQSNYLQTMAAITTYDGHLIIRKNLW